MDNSFGAAMAGLVIEDASRMSGARFADARGTGVARRVRTRRRVRAAGMGGASAVAVGALALGAPHIPWGVFEIAPGIGVTDCVTSSPSTGHVAYSVTPAEAEQLRNAMSADDSVVNPDTDGVDTAWYQEDHAAGIPPVSVRHMKDGRWLVTIGSGAEQQVEPDETGAVTIDVTVADVTTSYRVVRPAGGGIKVETTTSTVAGKASPSADDCYTPSPTPSGDASMSASSSPDASLAAKPEDVASSPFECGFLFPSASQSVEGMVIEGTGWLTSEEAFALLERRLNTKYDSSGNLVQGAHVPVTVHVDSTQLLPTFRLVDPAGSAVTGGYTGAEDPAVHPPTIDGITGPSGVDIKESAEGVTFVAVSEGVVIGTITDPWTPEGAPPVTWTNTELPQSLTLINPEGAFSACPGATLGDNFETYAVAGRMTMDADRVVTGPFYVWSEIAKP